MKEQDNIFGILTQNNVKLDFENCSKIANGSKSSGYHEN